MASVAEIIHKHEAQIMSLWLDEARAAASARGLSTVALENVMSSFLAALADQSKTGQSDANDRRHRQVFAHLSTRLRQGFDLAEIVQEFLVLGRCIAKIWQSLPEDQWPSAADIERLHLQIHVAMTDVTDTFHQHMLEDEQSEKRYLGRLQAIASEALHDPNTPLRDRLRDMLDIVMEAMGAQSAAFLLYNVARTELALVACTGAQSLEPYVTSLDPTSFAGTVASHQEPTPVFDASTTNLDVPDSLRRSGIRSLLGVRLPPHNDLLGVMFVGIAEAREFTPRELARIESLSDRLGLHLENARLFTALSEKVAALDVAKALRERFVSTLAHDLRGPLSAARLAAELLAMKLDESRELALRIDRNIERVDRMIRDLLDASRIQAGEPLPLRLDKCDLVALAERVADEARAVNGDRFIVKADGPVRGICSDDDLHRALWNLVSNAVKYGAPNQPITLSVWQHDGIARLAVHNVGEPIPPAEQEHIFDAYTRAASADASGKAGWGLGLTLVRGTAEAHGGSVSLKSDSESGTTFTIEVPLDARAARRTTDEQPSATVH